MDAEFVAGQASARQPPLPGDATTCCQASDGHALILAHSFGHATHPGSVLVGAGLHGELVWTPRMLVVIGRRRGAAACCKPKQSHLDILKAHDPSG